MAYDDGPPFENPFDAPGEEPPGPGELRSIVDRARRHHRRTGAIGMAATLIVGGAVGFAIAPRSTNGTRTVGAAGSPSEAATTAGAPVPSGASSKNGGAVMYSGSTSGIAPGSTGNSLMYTALFARTAGPVTIRGFLTDFPAEAGPATDSPASCGWLGPPAFEAELSTAKMVGTVDELATPDRTKPLSGVTTTVAGQIEGDPTVAVIAATAPSVTEVRMAFTNGVTDSMAPVKGWVTVAALEAALPSSDTAPIGTLSAIGSSGQVLSTYPVTLADGRPVLPMAPECSPSCPPTTVTSLPTSSATNGVSGSPAATTSCAVLTVPATAVPASPAPGAPVPATAGG